MSAEIIRLADRRRREPPPVVDFATLTALLMVTGVIVACLWFQALTAEQR